MIQLTHEPTPTLLYPPPHRTRVSAPVLAACARLFLLTVAVLLTGAIGAQEAKVVGHITDAEGEHLSFATVRVLGSVIGASSDVEGEYEIEVPPGRIQLIYTYVGYRDVDTTITVTNDQREIEVNVVMRSSQDTDLPDIIVFGTRAVGQAQALKLQQSGLLAQTIVHSELFNKYPDITIAETVSRIPGVSIIRGINEGEIVQVRGLPEQYTAVALNGQRLPTVQPEADQTGTLDLIQSNLVEEVRVIKSRTADMDGDAIGGTVDFRVRVPENKFELLALGGIGNNFGFDGNPDQSAGITQLTGVLNSEIADEKVYALAAGSYFRHGRGVQQTVFDYTGAGGATTPLVAARPNNVNQLTERRGFVGAVELRPSIYNRLRITYNYANTTEDVVHRQLFTDRLLPSFGAGPRRRTAGWAKERQLELVALEAENNFPHTRIDYQLSFSQTREDLVNRLSSFAYLDAGEPGPTLTEGSLARLRPNEPFDGTELSNQFATQENIGLEEDVAILSLNITRYLNDAKTGYLKIGGRYRTRDRTYGIFTDRQTLDGSSVTPGSFPAVRGGPIADSIPDLELDGLRYSARQRIQSYYAMYAANLTSRLSVSAGGRYERVEVGTREVLRDSFDFDANNLLPSINLTFRTKRRAKVRQARLSFYQAVAYANYATYLSDRRLGLSGLDEFSIGNQGIENTKSNNIDLTLERYGRRDGQMTFGIFYKQLDNPTLRVSETDYTSGPNPVYVTQLVNTPSANLVGLELGIYQNLGFLKDQSALRYFNFNATYNFNALSAEDREFNFASFTLPQAPRQTANASIVYNNPNKGYSVVVATNFRDRIFDRVLDDRPVYRNSVFSLDLSADFKVYKDFGLYARLNNLTDHPFREYFGEPNKDSSLLRSEARYGVWGVVGVRYQNR